MSDKIVKSVAMDVELTALKANEELNEAQLDAVSGGARGSADGFDGAVASAPGKKPKKPQP